jgi:5-methylcytosine-specific restriction endonuclease McrA
MKKPLKKQRITKNLGLNRSADSERIYAYIENVLGIKTKLCTRGRSRNGNKFSLVHKGPNPVPIRSFHLNHAEVDAEGNFHVKGDGLQGACIVCDRSYRRGRLSSNYEIHKEMSNIQIREKYVREYGRLAHCSRCKKYKSPKNFRIVRGMEKGLHNLCMDCSEGYSEAVGNRWIIYSPDGRNVVRVKGKKCAVCPTTKSLHKDHMWPLSKGGTDYAENIQILCGKHNLSKSASIIGIRHINEVTKKMICERYWDVLRDAKSAQWSIQKFEREMSKRVREFLSEKNAMTDGELGRFFLREKARNNRKHGIARAVRKFREFAEAAILDTKLYLTKNR